MSPSLVKFNFIISLVLSSPLCTAKLTGNDSCILKHLKPTPETSLLFFSAGYKVPVNKAVVINSGHGLAIEAGINVARLLSKNTLIGIYGGWSMMDKAWNTSFSPSFVNDYRASYNPDAGLNSTDSAVASSFGVAMNKSTGKSVTAPGCEMKSFHNYSLYYGIALKLPNRYSPVLKLYTGFTRSHFQGPGNLVTQKKDYNILQLRRSMYGAELILFRGWQAVKKGTFYNNHLNTGALSLYYECTDLSNASVFFDDGSQHTNISLRKITSNAFISKYRKETYLGIKLAFCIL